MKLKVVETESAPWYADGLQFSCTQCGNCCTGGPGFVWISDEEIDRLAAHMKLTRTQITRRYCRLIGGRWSLKEMKSPKNEYDCIFLRLDQHGKRTCAVYDVRPLQCRTWPFWDGLLDSRKAWDIAKQRCPGMDKGRRYSLQEIRALKDAEDWPGR